MSLGDRKLVIGCLMLCIAWAPHSGPWWFGPLWALPFCYAATRFLFPLAEAYDRERARGEE